MEVLERDDIDVTGKYKQYAPENEKELGETREKLNKWFPV